jgi:formylglycine-generating enzyme required for sulfatase activity
VIRDGKLPPFTVCRLRTMIAALLAACVFQPAIPGTASMAQSKAPRPAKPQSLKSFRDCPECPEMVLIPTGSFIMGSPANEPERQSYENPQHQMTIVKPFAVGKFTVTFAEWDACVAGGGCGGYVPDDHGWGHKNRPVINVSWNDVKAYAAWLSRKTGQNYRLLSEAEWEYAARAGSQTPFWWGSTITPTQANYDGTADIYKGGVKGEYRQQTVPMNSFQPNPFGLYQVHGNVWEWVEDCWHDNYEGAPADGSAWISESCGQHVLRGGSWASSPSGQSARPDFSPGAYPAMDFSSGLALPA